MGIGHLPQLKVHPSMGGSASAEFLPEGAELTVEGGHRASQDNLYGVQGGSDEGGFRIRLRDAEGGVWVLTEQEFMDMTDLAETSGDYLSREYGKEEGFPDEGRGKILDEPLRPDEESAVTDAPDQMQTEFVSPPRPQPPGPLRQPRPRPGGGEGGGGWYPQASFSSTRVTAFDILG